KETGNVALRLPVKTFSGDYFSFGFCYPSHLHQGFRDSLVPFSDLTAHWWHFLISEERSTLVSLLSLDLMNAVNLSLKALKLYMGLIKILVERLPWRAHAYLVTNIPWSLLTDVVSFCLII
ncbi:hypothetical protein M8C21_001537, partial [Ambrosia artemisiifolia]